MEEKYINKILNFADENINTAKELVINKEQAKELLKELEQDYVPTAIINLTIGEYKKMITTAQGEELLTLDSKIDVLQDLLEKRK